MKMDSGSKTCGAAMPTPSALSIVTNMSSMSLCTRGSAGSATFPATPRKTGCPSWAISLDLRIYYPHYGIAGQDAGRALPVLIILHDAMEEAGQSLKLHLRQVNFLARPRKRGGFV
jgi:hypothetical protein